LENDYWEKTDFVTKGLVNLEILLQYCLSSLPYLTNLKLIFFSEEQKLPQVFKYNNVIQGLTSERYNMILKMLALKAFYMSEFLPFNP